MNQFFIIIYKDLITITVILFLVSNSAAAQTNWTEYGNNPVLDVGLPGTWDSWRVNHHDVYLDEDTLKMWYTGETASPRHFKIGLATSTDGGITWVKDTLHNPVLIPTPGAWDSEEVGMPVVIFDENIYKMWYWGGSINGPTTGIGYATSPDGITWTKDTLHNPVMNIGSGWEGFHVIPNSVILDDTTYKMWYAGFTTNWVSRIGYATSPDGINWIKDTLHNPVLNLGDPGEWDDNSVYTADVHFDGTLYQIWYMGNLTRIGYATSSDGLNWDKDSSNPILNPGPPGSWDDSGLGHPRVIFDGIKYHLLFFGDDGSHLRIGYATAPVTGIFDGNYVTPVDFLLVQNYPNPFNPTTKINYQIPELSFVTLKVYDVLGNEIATLVNKEIPAGSYEATFDARKLSGGVYFYQLQTGGYVETKKMILMK